MISRGPGFLLDDDSAPWPPLFPPPPLQSPTCLSFSVEFTDGKGGGGVVGRGAKSYDGEKAWLSIKHSILSGQSILLCTPSLPAPCWGRGGRGYALPSFLIKSLGGGGVGGDLLQIMSYLQCITTGGGRGTAGLVFLGKKSRLSVKLKILHLLGMVFLCLQVCLCFALCSNIRKIV
jgi:hypothetical protein